MRVYLQTPFSADRAARFYHLFLQKDLLGGWMLVKESGYQGSSGTIQREHFADKEAALNALLRSRDAQIRRGYQVMYTQGESAPR